MRDCAMPLSRLGASGVSRPRRVAWAVAWVIVSAVVLGLSGCASEEASENAASLSLSASAQHAEREFEEGASSQEAGEAPDYEPAAPSGDEGDGREPAPEQKEDGAAMAVTESTKLTDLAANPAFGGWGYALQPWHGAREDGATIGGESSLLPYHSNVRPAQAVSALNRLIDDAAAGEVVAYPVYDEAAVAADPAKADVVLFCFRGEPGAPFAVVNPGGGFAYVGSLHESLPHAQWLSEQGINAFSLSYREGSGQWAVEDLAQALTFIFAHADELELSTEGYSLWGSSAGARMAAAIGSYGPAAFGGANLPRPATVIMAYTGQSEFTPDDPATYAVVGDRDGIANAGVMERRIQGLQRAGVAADIVVYPGMSHGFGTGEGTTAEGWMQGALDFWLAHR